VIKLGMHDLTYTRADLPSLDDTRATRTTVLQPSDYEDEDEGGDDESDERDDEERGGPAYSSMARGS
jgi:hypothetical protein